MKSPSTILPPISEADVAYTKKLPFGTICDMFTVIASTNKRSIKRAALEKLLSRYRLYYTYPMMRLILPHLDRDRQTYALKESKLAKAVIQILAIAEDSADALRMINWRQPQRNAVTGRHEGGDFAEAVYNSLKARCASHSTSTVASINAHLDALNSAQDGNIRNQILLALVREATAYEMKWIIRIILKDLKIGISEALVFEVFHEDATELYNITSSLYIVCNQLRDPNVRTSHQGISLFHPIKPMLAGRRQPEDIGTIISQDNRKFAIEQKYDGERVQVHKDGNLVRLFSRNSLEVTDIYPMIRADLYRQIKSKQAIIDGELLVWDRESQTFEPFGRAKTQALVEKGLVSSTLDENRDKKQFCFIAFDVLLIDGEAKMHLPLKTRMELLHKYIEVKEKVVEITEQVEVRSEQSVIEALNKAIDERHEGIMVKDLNSMYVPNERKDKWTKLKPEYLDGIGDTLDLLILGGLYGSGVRKGATISHFLLGVQKSPGVYWSIARVGSGYSDAELRRLQAMLQNYWRPYNPANPPKCIQLADTGIKDVPNVWIEPKYSRVLEILAAQITPSEKYRAGYTLRFPRVKRVRLDKVADQVTTMDELLDMVSLYESKAARTKVLAHQSKDAGASSSAPGPSSKKGAKRGLFTTHVFNGLAMAKLDEHPDKDLISGIFSKILAGKEICVINGDHIYRKDFLEQVIKNQGGTIAQAPTSKTYCAIAGSYSVKVKLLEDRKTTNIVWVKWLIASVQRSSLLPMEPRFMIYTEPKTQDQFKHEIDEFGDTFERLTDEATLRDVFDRIQVPWLPQSTKHFKAPHSISAKPETVKTEFNETEPPTSIIDLDLLPDLVKAEKELFGQPWWALFRSCVIYLDLYTNISKRPRLINSSSVKEDAPLLSTDSFASSSSQTLSQTDKSKMDFSPLNLLAPQLRFYGANIVDYIDVTQRLDYIVVDPSDQTRIPRLEQIVRNCEVYGYQPVIVEDSWVVTCISKKIRMNPADLLIHEAEEAANGTFDGSELLSDSDSLNES
jgi:DNA ligase-4